MAFNLLRPNVMLDLETTSTYFDAGILSIGAVKFDFSGILDRFYVNIKLTSIQKYGLHIDPETMKWWAEQKEGTIESLFQSAIPLDVALRRFKEWYGPDSLVIWSNGLDFDNVIMRHAFRSVGDVEPWKYWDGACFRTLKELIDPDRKMCPNKETAHNALIDAENQAEWAINMWKVWAYVPDEDA